MSNDSFDTCRLTVEQEIILEQKEMIIQQEEEIEELLHRIRECHTCEESDCFGCPIRIKNVELLNKDTDKSQID